MPAANAFHVVGMDRTSANRRDRFVEFTGLVHAIGMHGNLDIVGVRHTERLVNNTRIAGVILVHLQATGAGLNLADERLRRVAAAPAGVARFTGWCSKARNMCARLKAGLSFSPPVMSVVMPAARATGIKRGWTRCTCVSMPPGVAM